MDNVTEYIPEEQEQAVEETTATVEEEVVLHFKRFPKEKQDQVRALVNYATLMGLDGKDLVSIGGKLNRISEKRALEVNRTIIEGMGCRPIHKDRSCYNRWAWTSPSGVTYHFTASYSRYEVTNTATKRRSTGYTNERYNFGRYRYQESSDLPNIMLNVYHGNIILP